MKEISKSKLVFLGVHGDSAADQKLAAGIMGRISTKLKGKTAIGLEQARERGT